METPKILLVEDDLMGQTVVVRIFKRIGLEVDIAVNGRDAISKVEDGRYDLILMDVNMPEMNGIDATKYIRSHFDTQDNRIKILGMSGNTSDADIRSCVDAGMDGYISKPMHLNEFFQKSGFYPTQYQVSA